MCPKTPSPTHPDLLTPFQLAELLGLREQTIYNRLSNPRLRHLLPPSIKLGARRYWRRSTFDRWLEAQEEAPIKRLGRPRKGVA